MVQKNRLGTIGRRRLLRAGVAIGGLQVASPFIIKARGETPVKIGFIDPITGSLSALAVSEVEGAKWTVEQINKNGGILGRPVELLVEDSANDTGTGVQKAHKLIERDKVDVIMGDVNSGIAYAIMGVTCRRGRSAHRAGRPYRPDHRQGLQVEHVPHLQHDGDGCRRRHRRTGEAVRQEVVLHHARLRLRPDAAGQLRQEPESAAAATVRATCCRSQCPTSRRR